jgi:hypothetical protein
MNEEKNKEKTKKNKIQDRKNGTHHTIINPWIPMTLWYRYAVCCSVPKTKTVPVSEIPILETPQVYPYPCSTLTTTFPAFFLGSSGEHVWNRLG